MKKPKIIVVIRRIGGALLRMLHFSKPFGWNVACRLFYCDVSKYLANSKEGQEKANAKRHRVIEKYLRAKGYGAENVLTENVSSTTGDEGRNIWVCWWQGEKNMPEMVKKCFDNIVKYANGHPVKLITFDNYKDYVQIDKRIVDKVKSGKYMLAHLADLVRVKLLEQYGGLWLDSTILLTENINEDFFHKSFSVKNTPLDNNSVTEYKWCSFVLGGG